MRTILLANRKGGCGKTTVAVTLAAALAATGEKVALADADGQKSALRWLKTRPMTAAPILALDWTDSIGDSPKKCDWLVIDAPGALQGEAAERLIAEADAVVTPLLPSVFDVDSTRRFLKEIAEIKRVRKGKVTLHLIANRVRPAARNTARLATFFASVGQAPLAYITERTAYADLAARGLSIFDKVPPGVTVLRAQWHPVLAELRQGG